MESSALAYQAAIEGQGIALAQRVLVEAELNAGTLIAMEDYQLDCGSAHLLPGAPAGER